MKIIDILKVVIVIVLLPILIIVLPIWLLIFGNKSAVSAGEVMSYLKRMESGEVDDYWWDDFVNVPIKDEELDAIRNRCDEIWHPESGFLSKSENEGEYRLNQAGFSEISKLISRCETIASNNSSKKDALKRASF